VVRRVRQGGEVTASISVSGLTHRYRSQDGELTVLDDVSFTVPAAGYAALTGPSGAGKTTLLSLLGGLEAVQQGVVQVGDHDVSRLSGDALARYRRTTVGFVFQHFGLLESLTALENIELARSLAGISRSQRRREATELLDAVGLQRRHRHLPVQLSGGERQRVAIARAMANRPQVLLADEPTGNLDEESATTAMRLLESLHDQQGVTLVVVTHNRSIADRATTRLVLGRGRSPAPPLDRS
jgi:putative ABC transport system ATP-binding protein